MKWEPGKIFHRFQHGQSEGHFILPRMATLIIIMGIWGVLSSGCTWVWSRDTMVRCPKCSTAFTIEDNDIRMQQITR
jgi:hypothetical protein